MSKEHAESLALPDSTQAEDAPPARSRKYSADSVLARTRREAIALDGLMFESGSTVDDSSLSPTATEKHPEPTQPSSGGPYHVVQGQPDQKGISSGGDEGLQQIKTQDLQQKTASTYPDSSPSSSTTSTSSESSPGLLSAHEETHFESERENGLAPPSLARSVSRSKRQSLFLGDHITINQEGPIIVSPSSHSNSNDDQEDMKEVQIETEDPSHLFWVPFHLHPEIAPNEYNKWLSKHGVDSSSTDGAPSSRSPSMSRRKSVLSALYNPEEDRDDQPIKPAKIVEESQDSDFLSGVFSMPLDQMGEPPLKTKTSLRRSVSLSATSPTRDHFPTDAEEDLMAVKRPGALERGGLSLLRRSARTKIRRNSTASNDTRNDVSRLRQTISATGEYPAVSLVDNGPLPRPSTAEHAATADATGQDAARQRKEGDNAPLKRFVSTLRDSSKPTITTYVEPHLLEQQRKENKEAYGDKEEDEEAPSFRISAPGNLENSAAARSLAETTEHDRKEKLDNLALNYPIPPPVKLAQNLLQEPGPQAASPSKTAPLPSPVSHQQTKQKQSGQQHSNISHSKKPSTWSWLWGKERAGEKGAESSPPGSSGGASATGKANSPPSSQSQSADGNTPAFSSNESASKKPSTLSLLFSRNGKSASSKSQATTAENAQSSAMGGSHGLSSSSNKPKYSNYNRLPIHIERAIYRLSHVKLANPRRPLHEQVLISNMMFWYLGVIQQQQMLQQQADLQQQEQLQQQQLVLQQKHGRSGSPDKPRDDSREDKESKSKQKPKKRKSQKKKNRGSSNSAERIVKSPEYELQQQFHVDQSAAHPGRPRQQGSSLPSKNGAPKNLGRPSGDVGSHANGDLAGHGEESRRVGGVASYSDSYESDGDDYQPRHDRQHDEQKAGLQSDTLTGLSIKAAPGSQQEENEEDDDVPLGHYQNARGPKKHLKRLNAPKHWMLDKLTGTYAPRPTAGPHKLRECLPLVILMRNRLKYALNGKEVQSILMQRLVKVDGKVRTDSTFPAGFMDAISIEKTGENFRLVYDTKGRFTVHRITAEEAKYKLCKVKKVQLGAKGIPFVVTHDGRTLRYPDPLIKVNDTIKLDLETSKFSEFIKFEVGNVAMVTGGRNTGRVGVITHRERHIGGFDIVHIKDVLDRQFATRLSNVFVIGEGNKPWVSLPKNKGVKLTIAEERDRRRAAN
ncbi:40S ribosomal protein S4 [Mortierella alpina]|nr:40S ribosomal protein S4 [Mortierella alpina]